MATIFNRAEIEKKLPELEAGWAYDEKSGSLQKLFQFKGFLKTMSFVNAVAWQANKQMHHPDLQVSFNKCMVCITTHDSGNLVTEKDFALAMAIDRL